MYLIKSQAINNAAQYAHSIKEARTLYSNEIVDFNIEHDAQLNIRIGINTGSVVAGVIGMKKFTYDLWGDAVNTASRMESHGIPGAIQVSATTYERLKDKFVLELRGAIDIKGKGKMDTYLLSSGRI